MTLRLVQSTPNTDRRGASVDAVDELYDAYAPDVLRLARRLAGPSADIEDMVHDVFVVALQRAFTFQGGATVRTWLFRITHHVVRDRMRRGFLRGLLFRRRQDEMVAALPAPATPPGRSAIPAPLDRATLHRRMEPSKRMVRLRCPSAASATARSARSKGPASSTSPPA